MSFVQTFLAEFDNEMRTTRTMLERIPFREPAWKPHAKSMAIVQLANHIAGVAMFGEMIAVQDGRDMARPKDGSAPPAPPAPENVEQLLATFDSNVAKSRAALEKMPESSLGDTWTLRNGEHIIMSMPRAAILRVILMNHLIHHRGQLSVYLRLNDVPLPSVYGPTADT